MQLPLLTILTISLLAVLSSAFSPAPSAVRMNKRQPSSHRLRHAHDPPRAHLNRRVKSWQCKVRNPVPVPSPSPAPVVAAVQGAAAVVQDYVVPAVSSMASSSSSAEVYVPPVPATSTKAAPPAPAGNYDEEYLNTGINGGGWAPPFIPISALKVVELSSVLGGVFAPCAPYVDIFYSAAASTGIPAIILASIAMQESTCNPNAVGGGGEQGLMQITPEKCAGAPAGCMEPWFNINKGASYLKSTIDGAGGNFLQALGTYNGWFPGTTYNDATSRRWTACKSQNNLDYLYQNIGGWYLGSDGHKLGTYRNLDSCLPW